MKGDNPTFQLEIEHTTGLCPAGERYAKEQLRMGRIPVLSCEGPCIRGEIARQAAHRVSRQQPFARACQGEAVAVPDSAMARWIRDSERVVVLDGCFLRCQARMMRRLLQPDQLVEIDALRLYGKYVDQYEIDSVPEAERNATADKVAQAVLDKLAALRSSASINRRRCDVPCVQADDSRPVAPGATGCAP